MSQDTILFSRPYGAPGELDNLRAVLASDHAHGDGPFTASATERLTRITGAAHALLTTSCTHALELASQLLNLGPGDEVIVPSFTFPSAADAIVTTGATPVFVDIDDATGNIDPDAAAAAVTERTRAVSVMHYGGVAVDIPAIERLADEHDLAVIEDNAHGLGARWRGRALGTIGTFATQSFHDTKNVHCGEGGALLLGDEYIERAEVIREKGTNRRQFLRGAVDKYTWVDRGSSYLPSELNAAVLDAQLAAFPEIQRLRHRVWDAYAAGLAAWAADAGVHLMPVPDGVEHPAHLFFLLLADHRDQQRFIRHMRDSGIATPFHYIPLDTAPAGVRFGRTPEPCVRSQSFSERLVRLPLWPGLTDDQVHRVIAAATCFRTGAA